MCAHWKITIGKRHSLRLPPYPAHLLSNRAAAKFDAPNIAPATSLETCVAVPVSLAIITAVGCLAGHCLMDREGLGRRVQSVGDVGHSITAT